MQRGLLNQENLFLANDQITIKGEQDLRDEKGINHTNTFHSGTD